MIDFNSPSGPVMSSPRSRAARTSSAIAARSLADAVDDDVLFFASLGIALTPLTVSVNYWVPLAIRTVPSTGAQALEGRAERAA